MILCISGKRESGKSLLASFIVPHGFKRLSLANPLKEMCRRQYGLTDDQLYGKQKESPTQYIRTDSSFYTPRDILIREGCLKRSIDPLFWCKLLENDMRFYQAEGSVNFVVDDIRFLNEINFFKKINAKFVRLERSQDAIGKAALDDLSETELDSYRDWDFKLDAAHNINPSDLEKFAEHIVCATTSKS
jgi:hypothetical protein